MSQRVETRKLVGVLVADELAKHNLTPMEKFEQNVAENAINYALADHYRQTLVNFDDPGLWLGWIGNDVLTVVIRTIRGMISDPNLPPGTKERLDVLESRLNKNFITSLT